MHGNNKVESHCSHAVWYIIFNWTQITFSFTFSGLHPPSWIINITYCTLYYTTTGAYHLPSGISSEASICVPRILALSSSNSWRKPRNFWGIEKWMANGEDTAVWKQLQNFTCNHEQKMRNCYSTHQNIQSSNFYKTTWLLFCKL